MLFLSPNHRRQILKGSEDIETEATSACLPRHVCRNEFRYSELPQIGVHVVQVAVHRGVN